jgi:hypothetical protein
MGEGFRERVTSKSPMVQAIGLFLWLENGVVPEAQTVMVPFAPAWEPSKIIPPRKRQVNFFQVYMRFIASQFQKRLVL